MIQFPLKTEFPLFMIPITGHELEGKIVPMDAPLEAGWLESVDFIVDSGFMSGCFLPEFYGKATLERLKQYRAERDLAKCLRHPEKLGGRAHWSNSKGEVVGRLVVRKPIQR